MQINKIQLNILFDKNKTFYRDGHCLVANYQQRINRQLQDTVLYYDSRTLQETTADNCTQATLTASYLISLQPREDTRQTMT